MNGESAIAGSLAEAARRLLRSSGAILMVPSELVTAAHSLSLRVSDELPGMLNEPEVRLGKGWIAVQVDGLSIVQIGGSSPDVSICWVPSKDLADSWVSFSKIVIDLLIAGYPGCVGCAGPAAERPWKEDEQRLLFDS